MPSSWGNMWFPIISILCSGMRTCENSKKSLCFWYFKWLLWEQLAWISRKENFSKPTTVTFKLKFSGTMTVTYSIIQTLTLMQDFTWKVLVLLSLSLMSAEANAFVLFHEFTLRFQPTLLSCPCCILPLRWDEAVLFLPLWGLVFSRRLHFSSMPFSY